MNAIERLARLAPPPKVKIGAGNTEQWNQLEAAWGLQFPADFKELISKYGAGRFANYFGVVNPFYSAQGDITFEEFVRLRTRDMVAAKASYPETAVSLPVYPEKNGLFPWGYTDNGETMCWLTCGNNYEWPIICLEVGYLNTYDRFELSVVEFIEGWLSEKIEVPTLTPPDLFPLQYPVYAPLS